MHKPWTGRAAYSSVCLRMSARTIVIDCTELYLNPVRTGIQRVVRELLRHWPSSASDLLAARFDPAGRLLPLPSRTIRLLTDHEDGVSELPYQELVYQLQESSEEPVGMPWPLDPVLFIPEVFYDHARCRFYQRQLANGRDSLALLAYDFLAYLQPELFEVRTITPLMPYLRLMRCAPHVAYISDQTCRDYARIVHGHIPQRGPVLPLGADGLNLERQLWRPDRKDFVALGSLDGRKNQKMITAAFIELWNAGYDVTLTIIGRAFDGVDLRWLNEAKCFQQFRWLEAATDRDVQQTLRHARATVYVPEKEGFGLPPVESLAAGIPVITSALVPSVAMLPSSGQIRLAELGSKAIAEAVIHMLQDDVAESLWNEARCLHLGSWREFALSTASWLSDLAQ